MKPRQDTSGTPYQCPICSSHAARRQTGHGCTDSLDVTVRDVVEPWGQPVSIFFSVSEKPPGNLVVKSWEAGRGGPQSTMIIKHVEIWPTGLLYRVCPLSVAVRHAQS